MSYYLIHIKPSEKLEKILDNLYKHNDALIEDAPSSGFHCTIFGGFFDDNMEEKIIKTLESINSKKFYMTTKNFDYFAKHSLVLTLKNSDQLKKIHLHVADELKNVVKKLSKNPYPFFDQDEERQQTFKEYGSPFYGQFYSPHIRIGKIQEKYYKSHIINHTELINVKWQVNRIHLLKKTDKTEKIGKIELE